MKSLFFSLVKIALSILLVLAILTAPSIFVYEEEARTLNLHAPVEVLTDFISEFGAEDFLVVYFGKTPRNMMNFIPEFVKASFLHLMIATVISMLLGIALGVFFGTRKRHTGIGGLTLFSAIPDFILAMFLQLLTVFTFQHYGIQLGKLNYAMSEGEVLAFPLIIIVAISVSYVARSISQKLMTVATEDYIQYAKAKGLSRRVIIFRHMLTAVLHQFRGDIIKLVSITMGSLFIIERMFAIPGLTRLLFNFGFQLQFGAWRGITSYDVNFRITLVAIFLIACIMVITYIVCYLITLILKRICAHETIFS